MMEDNERLLQQFFSEASRQQIDDNGFSQRVVNRLPSRINWFVRLWTGFCVTLFVVLFIVFRGWELLAVHFEVMLRSMAAQPVSDSLMMIFSVVFGLLFVGVGEVISSETARR